MNLGGEWTGVGSWEKTTFPYSVTWGLGLVWLAGDRWGPGLDPSPLRVSVASSVQWALVFAFPKVPLMLTLLCVAHPAPKQGLGFRDCTGGSWRGTESEWPF